MSEHDITMSPILDLFESLAYPEGMDSHNAEVVDGKKIIKKFSSISEEINSLCKGVGLRDISHKGIIELRGKDVLDFLHRITTGSIKELAKEKLTHTIFTNEKGRIIDITTLLNFDDYQLLVCNTENKFKVRSWIDKYTISDDVKALPVSGVNNKHVLLELSGPQTNSFLMLICGGVVNNIHNNSFKVINAEGMLFFLAKILNSDGSIKYWIIADPENGRKLVRYMSENIGPYDFNFIGEDAYNVYRIGLGIPASPNEINDQVNPHEIRMLDYIDFKKGCYIGQEVIARLETYDKVQKYLMGVKFQGDIPHTNGSMASGGTFILLDEEGIEAGKVTSLAWSDKFKSFIGLALIKRLYAKAAVELTAKNDTGNEVKVIVSELPFKK